MCLKKLLVTNIYADRQYTGWHQNSPKSHVPMAPMAEESTDFRRADRLLFELSTQTESHRPPG